MSAEPSRIAGAPARGWKPYPAYKDSGVEWMGKVPEQGSETANIFQTGLTGLTGCVLLLNPIHPVILSRINKPQMNADERRYIHVTDFGARLDKYIHRKGREERKAEQQKSLRPLRSLRLTGINGIAAQEAAL